MKATAGNAAREHRSAASAVSKTAAKAATAKAPTATHGKPTAVPKARAAATVTAARKHEPEASKHEPEASASPAVDDSPKPARAKKPAAKAPTSKQVESKATESQASAPEKKSAIPAPEAKPTVPVASKAAKHSPARDPEPAAANEAAPEAEPVPARPPVASAARAASPVRPGFASPRQAGAPVPPRPMTVPRALAKAEVFVEGDHVVYPTHGVGKVERIAVEEIAGHRLELIHITFEENRMTLRVPVTKARTAGLRKLATRALFDKALDVLKGRARIKRTMWSRRAQEYEAKINSGDPLAIAEVVRDLHRNAGQPDQSFSERQIYEAAMDRLAAELAALDRTDKATAATKLVDFLKTV